MPGAIKFTERKNGLVPASGGMFYRVRVCTANLGASQRKAGDPNLKHCFALVEDAGGGVLRSLAYGRGGLVVEPHPDIPSVHCETQAEGLSEAQAGDFIAAFEECGSRPYLWGENDCCSCVQFAVEHGLHSPPLEMINAAANDISRSPEVFP